jgi:hypothetical protein
MQATTTPLFRIGAGSRRDSRAAIDGTSFSMTRPEFHFFQHRHGRHTCQTTSRSAEELSLSWFDGEDAGGTLTLDILDDANVFQAELWRRGASLSASPLRRLHASWCGAESRCIRRISESNDPNWVATGTPALDGTGAPNKTLPTFPLASGCQRRVGECWKTDLMASMTLNTARDLRSPFVQSLPAPLNGACGPHVGALKYQKWGTGQS